MLQVRQGVRFDDPNGLPRIAWVYVKLLEVEVKLPLMRELLTAAAGYMEQLDHEVSACPRACVLATGQGCAAAASLVPELEVTCMKRYQANATAVGVGTHSASPVHVRCVSALGPACMEQCICTAVHVQKRRCLHAVRPCIALVLASADAVMQSGGGDWPCAILAAQPVPIAPCDVSCKPPTSKVTSSHDTCAHEGAGLPTRRRWPA